MRHLFNLAVVMLLASCKSSQKCDAYGYIEVGRYDYIQVIGYTDTVPTYGTSFIQLPKGEYKLKAWKDKEEYLLKIKL
jgi:hypothetical protein